MKKNFVKVVFFGALALSTVTYVGCTDYDDDVKNLQEQIDKINAKEPGVSTEAMNSAIQSAVASLKSQLETAISGKADNASVQALQTKVNELVAALENKADASKITELVEQIGALSTEVNNIKGSLDEEKTKLQAQINELEAQIVELKKQIGSEEGGGETPEDTSMRDQLNKLVTNLANAQNELTRIDQATKDNAGEIVKLAGQIAELGNLKATVEALEAAHADFAQKGDLDAYYTKEEIANLIDTELASYMTSDQVATYVDEIVKTTVLTKITSINERLGKFDEGLSKVSDDFAKYCQEQSLTYNSVIERIKALEDYKSSTLTVLETTVKGQGEDLATALLDIKALSDKFAGYATTSALEDVETSVKSYVDEKVKECTDKLSTLEKTLESLRVDVDGLMNRIQSIMYLPEASDRKVSFYTFFAKEKSTDATYKVLNLGGISTKEVKFRVSPASAAKDFLSKYVVTFSADQKITRSLPTEYFTYDEKKVVVDENTGIITFGLRPNTTESYAVCMHVASKADKVEEVGKVEMTSDYFAAMVSDKFIVDAYYKFNGTAAQTIIYTTDNAYADYSDGEIMLNLSDNANGTTPSSEALAAYPDLAGAFNTTFEIDNSNFFKVAGATVLLKTYNTPSYIGEVTNVSAKVISTGLYTPATSTSIGTVEVIVNKATPTITYDPITVEWKKTANSIDATNFPLNKIYDDPAVRLTPLSFAGLPGVATSTDKVQFVVGSGNALSVSIDPQTPAGTYPVEAKFTSTQGDLEITVKGTVIITDPEIATLMPDPVLWKDNMVGITMTPDNVNNLSSITLDLNLFELFTNYTSVADAASIKGAVFTVDVPNWNNIPGIDYNDVAGVLTITPEDYSGMDNQGDPAVLGVSAKVALPGTTEPLQDLYATITFPNASGSWKAGLTNVSFKNQSEVIPLAKDFAWSDMRADAKVMWKDGVTVVGDDSNGFASSVTNALDIYGLNSPTFVFCDVDGKNERSDDKYLSLVATTTSTNSVAGTLTIRSEVQGFDFKDDYEVYVKVKASSQWGDITGYDNAHSIIKVTIPTGVK